MSIILCQGLPSLQICGSIVRATELSFKSIFLTLHPLTCFVMYIAEITPNIVELICLKHKYRHVKLLIISRAKAHTDLH